MAPSRKNLYWVGGGHWCDYWLLAINCGLWSDLPIFSLELVASLGLGIVVGFFVGHRRVLHLLLVTLFASSFLPRFGHLCVLVAYFAEFLPLRASFFGL